MSTDFIRHAQCADCGIGRLLAKVNVDPANDEVVGTATSAVCWAVGRRAVLGEHGWVPPAGDPPFNDQEKAAGVQKLTDDVTGLGGVTLGRIVCGRTWEVDQDGPVCYCLADVERVPVPAAFPDYALQAQVAEVTQ